MTGSRCRWWRMRSSCGRRSRAGSASNRPNQHQRRRRRRCRRRRSSNLSSAKRSAAGKQGLLIGQQQMVRPAQGSLGPSSRKARSRQARLGLLLLSLLSLLSLLCSLCSAPSRVQWCLSANQQSRGMPALLIAMPAAEVAKGASGEESRRRRKLLWQRRPPAVMAAPAVGGSLKRRLSRLSAQAQRPRPAASAACSPLLHWAVATCWPPPCLHKLWQKRQHSCR